MIHSGKWILLNKSTKILRKFGMLWCSWMLGNTKKKKTVDLSWRWSCFFKIYHYHWYIVMQWSSSNRSHPERILSSQFIIRQRLHIDSPLRVLVLAQKENELSWAKRMKAVLVVQTTRDTSHRNWNPSTSDDLFSFRSDLTPRQLTLSANHVFHSRKTTSCPVQSVVRRLLIGDDEIRSGNSRCTYSR